MDSSRPALQHLWLWVSVQQATVRIARSTFSLLLRAAGVCLEYTMHHYLYFIVIVDVQE